MTLASKLKRVLQKGHFLVTTPDGETEDFDVALPGYFTRATKGEGWECIDSNGSEVVPDSCVCTITGATFVLHVDDREYERGDETYSYKELDLLVRVSQIEKDGTLVVDSVVEYTGAHNNL
jgi:hypothetical protein